MSLPSLACEDGANKVTVCDERDRWIAYPHLDRVASVTFSGGDTSWGEFLSRDEARALHAWLGVLLA